MSAALFQSNCRCLCVVSSESCGISDWKQLFDIVIVSANKPEFFSNDSQSLYQVVTTDGLVRPVNAIKCGNIYSGGSAAMVEEALSISGSETLYVGDHIYTDVGMSKVKLKWRTCLILQELEKEIQALAKGTPHRKELKKMMQQKQVMADAFNQLRLEWQRSQNNQASSWGPEGRRLVDSYTSKDLQDTLASFVLEMEQLDEQIGPMLEQDGRHFNKLWGYLSRAGLNDKSHLTRQIEKYADVYTSRVSNFVRYTPYMYFRSPSQSLAHDRHFLRAWATGPLDKESSVEVDSFVNYLEGNEFNV
mmetsp:Transcript_28616/g.39535  ORF Transcript_28616/g.39535 Transcript_28616/m.39535 type:complete len:304 (+) Transcript_28616:293-1204(+)